MAKLNFIHILTLLFVVFKITNYIDWSWWLVFSPIILALVIVFVDGIVNKGK
jgi:hypothetical protein